MDKVIVSALLIIASITAATITINVIGVGLDRGGTSLVQSQRDTAHRIQSSITIISAGSTGPGEILYFWLKGSGNVVIKPLSSFDVFLRRGDGTCGGHFPYSEDETEDHYWKPVSDTENLLNPRETLEIKVIWGLDCPLQAGVHVLLVVTPEGVTDEYVFEVPPEE